MMRRVAIVAASIALAACAGLEPAGRNAGRAPAPPPAASTAAPAQTAPTLPPPQTGAQPSAAPTTNPPLVTAPAPTTTAPAAAPDVAAPPPTQPRRAQSDPDDAIVVPGQREQQVRPPAGDPRSIAERMEDVRAWDQCVMQVQSAFESDPMRPQLTSPEEYCRQSLGMADRLAVPASRRERRR
ncbi:MAG TPA: hypothetical protein VEA80_14605 [Vitreimonas sp.]|uniref:hypothetical protein n=1 Tax=Vitreimonas sp. TaxID=3069702 RepID=UPI002D595A61|nr:hypothetical protein [Vitreimonas sp.]HYD88702.1 hypothetical protein [Vitreimonas sp.]